MQPRNDPSRKFTVIHGALAGERRMTTSELRRTSPRLSNKPVQYGDLDGWWVAIAAALSWAGMQMMGSFAAYALAMHPPIGRQPREDVTGQDINRADAAEHSPPDPRQLRRKT